LVKRVDYSIIIPAYNEAKRIPATLDSILVYIGTQDRVTEIIVVNDGSTDSTADVVPRYARLYPVIRLVNNSGNRGKGYSIRAGVREAAGDAILFADADNSTPIEHANEMIQAIEDGADIVLGSRWIDREAQRVPQPWYRRLNGRTYNLLVRSILRLDFK